MEPAAPLTLFNSLTRHAEPFEPVHEGEARVYTCGPTVYNYPHIGNMRAYVFADVLGRTLSFKGYKLTHVINITDVGHLTDDADDGEDKMERMAAAQKQSIWDIAEHYKQAYWADVRALNIRQPAHWTVATDYVPQMIEFAEGIASEHCYELESGLYFDVSTVADYGRLARAQTEDGEGRIEAVEGKRNAADFAIWRKTPPGETRQMEWDSPWGKGAPGWHLECSVMSGAVLGFPFDIHTGGIDHREIHHPNEIAQNQAHCCTNGLDDAANSGAKVWMHNNFLVERSGKMSKSSGEFLRLQLLIDKGYHPLAYRLLCLQAHYRSELEFSWEGLGAALTRLKRLVIGVTTWRDDVAFKGNVEAWRVDVQHRFDQAISEDLNTPVVLTILEEVIAKKGPSIWKRDLVEQMDKVLGLGLLTAACSGLGDSPLPFRGGAGGGGSPAGAALADGPHPNPSPEGEGLVEAGSMQFGKPLTRADLRLRPKSAEITEAEIEATLAARKEARAAKDFARSDALRDELAAKGVEVMDGDPLGWEWKLG